MCEIIHHVALCFDTKSLCIKHFSPGQLFSKRIWNCQVKIAFWVGGRFEFLFFYLFILITMYMYGIYCDQTHHDFLLPRPLLRLPSSHHAPAPTLITSRKAATAAMGLWPWRPCLEERQQNFSSLIDFWQTWAWQERCWVGGFRLSVPENVLLGMLAKVNLLV